MSNISKDLSTKKLYKEDNLEKEVKYIFKFLSQ
jgi:hypothetical protein